MSHRDDLHSTIYDEVNTQPPGHWRVAHLARALHEADPTITEREFRFLIWDCINGGSLRLRQRDGHWEPYLEPASADLERARACTRFRHLVMEERTAGGTPLAELVPPPSPPRPSRESRMTIWDLHWLEDPTGSYPTCGVGKAPGRDT
jgi:hypothetical protein